MNYYMDPTCGDSAEFVPEKAENRADAQPAHVQARFAAVHNSGLGWRGLTSPQGCAGDSIMASLAIAP